MKDKAAGAMKHRTTILPPLEFSPAPTIASDQRKVFRQTVKTASTRSTRSVSCSRERLPSHLSPAGGVLF